MSDAWFDSYPYLEQLLAGYFHQDWMLDDDTVEEVVTRFLDGSHAVDVWATVADIRRFLAYKADADAAYGRIFPNEMGPPEVGMGAGDWLRWLERLILRGAPVLPEGS